MFEVSWCVGLFYTAGALAIFGFMAWQFRPREGQKPVPIMLAIAAGLGLVILIEMWIGSAGTDSTSHAAARVHALAIRVLNWGHPT